jgi:hypothetical protein
MLARRLVEHSHGLVPWSCRSAVRPMTEIAMPESKEAEGKSPGAGGSGVRKVPL